MKCLTMACEVSFYPVKVHKMNLQILRKRSNISEGEQYCSKGLGRYRLSTTELTWWEMMMRLKTAAGRREFWTCGADQSCPQWELRWRLDNSFGDEDVSVLLFVFPVGHTMSPHPSCQLS